MSEEALAHWGADAPKANKTRLINVCVLCVRVIYTVLYYLGIIGSPTPPVGPFIRGSTVL